MAEVAPVSVLGDPEASFSLILLDGPYSLLFLGSTETYEVCIRTIVAILERSNRCAESTADTIAPSRADRSHSSSVTRNLRAKLKKAEGPFDTLTAITCRGGSGDEVPLSLPCSDECSDSVPVVPASIVVGVVGVNGPFLSTNDKEEMATLVASVPGVGASAELLERTGAAVGDSPTSDLSPPLPLSDILFSRDVMVGRIFNPPIIND